MKKTSSSPSRRKKSAVEAPDDAAAVAAIEPATDSSAPAAPETPLEPAAPIRTPPEAVNVVPVKVGRIAIWDKNPRRFRDDQKFQELIAMVEAHGILQNLVLRPNPDREAAEDLLLVCGERRWRAAIRAGLSEVPAVIRADLDERGAFEVALVENVGREDMAPVDEAAAYQTMMLVYRYSVEDVAAKVGKPLVYVRQRLVLCRLIAAAQDWTRDDRMTIGGAIELARVSPEIQQRFLDDMGEDIAVDGALNADAVRGLLRTRYLYRMQLAQAPFDASDSSLVPDAGSCGSCPKNTTAQRDLFESEEDLLLGKGTCLDEACWGRKVDATVQRAAAAGAHVIEGAEADRVLEAQRRPGKSDLVALSETCYADRGEGGYRTFDELLQPALRPEDIVMVRPTAAGPAGDGKLLRCVRRDRLQDLMKDAGHADIAAREQREAKKAPGDAQNKAAMQQKASERAEREAIKQAGQVLEAELRTHLRRSSSELADFLRHLICLLWTRNNSNVAKERGLGDRGVPYEWDPKKIKPEPRLEKLDAPALFAFLAELVLEDRHSNPRGTAAFGALGIDLDELTKAQLGALREKGRAKKAKAKTAAGRGKKKGAR